MKPAGVAQDIKRKYHRVVKSRPISHSTAPISPRAIMMSPIPTMMRKAKNGMIGLGRSSGGNDFSPRTSPSHSWVRMRLPRSGMATS